MSGEEDGFLGRWSRLKRERAKPAPEAAPEPEVQAAPEPEPEPEPEHAPEPETLSEEELAALPRLEDLTEGSDISAFLRAGVPRDLRNGALRRMWMLTPAIRDYRDPAVDYAWDWNTPGGVPGDGVAPSPERAAEMLRDLLSPRQRPEPTEEAPAPEAGEASPAAPEAEPPAPAAGQPPAPEPVARADEEAPAPDSLPRRRHGSALPG